MNAPRGASLAAMLAATVLAGCASTPKLKCPAGQAPLRTAQLFLQAKPPAKVSDADLRQFVDTEVIPRFPVGVTVVNGGGQWSGDENRLIREAAKVVMIVLPDSGDPMRHVEAVRAAYRAKFHQNSVVVTPPPSCAEL